MLVVVVVLGALSVAVASAVRATSGPTAPGRQAVVAAPVTPGVSATAPAGPQSGVGRRPPAMPAPVGSAAPEPVKRAAARVVTVPAPTVPSRAIGLPHRGRLAHGVLLPPEGPDHTTWDLVEEVSPNRDWRRVGSDRLVKTLLTVAARYRRAHPGAPRVVINDLSLPQGGRFGPEYGGLGHASHQNGLDADISYPRADGQEIGVDRVGQIDRELSQALVDAFVAAGARYVFVGPRTRLRGPRSVVQELANHDDHLHLRIPNRG